MQTNFSHAVSLVYMLAYVLPLLYVLQVMKKLIETGNEATRD